MGHRRAWIGHDCDCQGSHASPLNFIVRPACLVTRLGVARMKANLEVVLLPVMACSFEGVDRVVTRAHCRTLDGRHGGFLRRVVHQ